MTSRIRTRPSPLAALGRTPAIPRQARRPIDDTDNYDETDTYTRQTRRRMDENNIPPATSWRQDETCVGQEDPILMDTIPAGQGFFLEAEKRCYDINSLAQTRLRNPQISYVGPMTRTPFTDNDNRRIDDYIREHPNLSSGGKNKRKKRKTHKMRKTNKRINKKRKATRCKK